MTRIKLSLAQTAVLIGIVILALGLGARPTYATELAAVEQPIVLQAMHWDHCGLGNVCLYSGVSGEHVDQACCTGRFFQAYVAPGQCYNLTGVNNNMADSFWNRKTDGKHVQFYTDSDCRGDVLPYGEPVPSGGTAGRGSFPCAPRRGGCTHNSVSSIFGNTG